MQASGNPAGAAEAEMRWRPHGNNLGSYYDGSGRLFLRLLITPRPQKRRGAVGLLAHLEAQAVAFPKVERHTMPFK